SLLLILLPSFPPLSSTMTSRPSPLLALLLTSLLPFLLCRTRDPFTLAPIIPRANATVPRYAPLPSVRSPDLIKMHIDKQQAHYDFDNCGISAGGRARRGMGDDYVDGLDFDVTGAGAEDAPAKEMPWAVAIVIKVPSLPHRLCAGTLVSRLHVLSAAHCLASSEQLPARPGHVRCDINNHIDLDAFMQHSTVKYGGECLHGADAACDDSMIAKQARIKKITLFPFFLEDCSRGSDLVILELDQDVDAPHACLPHLTNMNETMRNSAFHTFKWSADKSKGVESAQRLQAVAPLTLREDRCALKWRSLSPDVLCAAPAKHIEQCIGESGAGLMTVSGGRHFLVGVLSSSSGCAPETNPKETPESRFTDVRVFSATIDRALRTTGPMPDFSDL
ncbi:hypothetical protein PMAYCL1PPCAC_27066, partial [Pristionchus mayeri]